MTGRLDIKSVLESVHKGVARRHGTLSKQETLMSQIGQYDSNHINLLLILFSMPINVLINIYAQLNLSVHNAWVALI